MAATASLSVLLQAVTNKFDKRMKRSSKVVARFGAGVSRVGKRLALMGGVAATVSAGAIAALTRAGLKNVDAMSKLSDRTGIATEQLAGLKFAAEQTGAGSERLIAALDVMQKRLGEVAIKGTGAARDALAALNLSVEDLIRMSPEEQFKSIAEAISNLDTQSERAAATANIFSRANQDLLNTLQLGRRGLEQMQEQAERLGLTFDRVSGKQVENANDAINRLKNIVVGLGNAFAVGLAPWIELAADKLETFIHDSGGIQRFVAPLIEATVKGFLQIPVAINQAIRALKKYQLAWLELKLSVGESFEEITGYEVTEISRIPIDAARKMAKDLRVEIASLGVDIDSQLSDVDKIFDKIRNMSRENARKSVEEARDGINETSRALGQAVSNTVGEVVPRTIRSVAQAARDAVGDPRAFGLGGVGKLQGRSFAGSRFRAGGFAQNRQRVNQIFKDQLVEQQTMNERLNRILTAVELIRPVGVGI